MITPCQRTLRHRRITRRSANPWRRSTGGKWRRKWTRCRRSLLLFYVGLFVTWRQCSGSGSGSWSVSQRYGSGSFHHQAKDQNSNKNLVLWLLCGFLSVENDVNVPATSNKQKNLKVMDENRKIRRRSLIRSKMSGIRNTARRVGFCPPSRRVANMSGWCGSCQPSRSRLSLVCLTRWIIHRVLWAFSWRTLH